MILTFMFPSSATREERARNLRHDRKRPLLSDQTVVIRSFRGERDAIGC